MFDDLKEILRFTALGSDGQDYEVVEYEPRGTEPNRAGGVPTRGAHVLYVPALGLQANVRMNGTLWFQGTPLTMTRKPAG